MSILDLSTSEKSRIELESRVLSRILTSSVEIEAPVEKVWMSFSDYNTWGEWNSFIPMVNGEVKAGKEIEIKVVAPGLKEMIFKPSIFTIEESKKVSWGGSFSFLYKGIHEFIFEPIGKTRTKFIQIEKFQGPIVLFMGKMINQTALGYINMNEEFKDYMEKQ